MPLPDQPIQWPPKPFDDHREELKTHNAWYANDTDELTRIYRAGGQVRPAQLAGGVVGALARFWWGRPNEQENHRLHIPAASDVARAMSDLIFSQSPMFVVGEDDSVGDRDAAQKRLQKLTGEDDTATALLEAAELGSALGGTFLRLWWDKEISDKVMFSSVPADSAVPEWRYDRLSAVTFSTVVRSDKDVLYRHLERHEAGKIFHGLYRGEAGHLGRKLPLEEVPETEWAGKIVDKDGAILTGSDMLAARYVPNVRPNRKWRTVPGLAPLGRSDFDGLEPLFDALDEAYTSWMRDLDLGKARLFVDEDMLRAEKGGQGASFDSEQAIFTPMKAGLGSAVSGGSGIMANQFTIRWQEHSNTCAELLAAIMRGAGLSSSSVADGALTAAVSKTATEVNSADRMSERTRDKKIKYWKSELRPLSMAAMQIDNHIFGTGIELKEMPEVRFPIRPQQDPVAQSGSIAALRAANSMSIEQSVRERNPNWSSDDVNDEVDRITKDMKMAAELMMAQPEPPEFDDPQYEGDDAR